MILFAIIIGILVGIVYGLLLKHQIVKRSPHSVLSIYLVSFLGIIVRLALFSAFAYAMLRYSLYHLILMLIAFFGSFWIIITGKGGCICKALISFRKKSGNLLNNSD